MLTLDDLRAMPEDGTERWLIRGRLRTRPPLDPRAKSVVRDRRHAVTAAAVGTAVLGWARRQSEPRGSVFLGVSALLRADPASVWTVDVVYADAAAMAAQPETDGPFVGAPTLAVEILSPNDTQEQTTEKVREYLTAGVPLVWVIDPDWRTVRVHRSDRPTQSFNDTERMPEYPEMPGFAPTVAELFD